MFAVSMIVTGHPTYIGACRGARQVLDGPVCGFARAEALFARGLRCGVGSRRLCGAGNIAIPPGAAGNTDHCGANYKADGEIAIKIGLEKAHAKGPLRSFPNLAAPMADR